MGSPFTRLLTILLFTFASLICISFSQLPTEYSIVGHNLDVLLSEERVREVFEQWKLKHKKIYTQADEAIKRYENFKSNLEYIVEKNSKKKLGNNGHFVGLNKFADMSNEEFRKFYLSKVKKPIVKNVIRTGIDQSCEAPSSLDWRKRGVVTGVKDQGSCGSCWAFSSTGAIEGINAIVTEDLISLSEQELVDCDTTSDGCDGGYMDYAFEWVINNGGIDTETDYPYTGIGGTCNITKLFSSL